jgi:hypothetical protein
LVQLHQQLAAGVSAWREQGYACEDYPTITEILDWSRVNTTGTPYFRRQPPRDVVFWYGLSQGIKDGYLKDLGGNIQAYDFADNAATYVGHVVRDFFRDCGDVKLPKGAPAVRKWERLNPDRLRYEMIFTDTDTVAADRPGAVRRFVGEAE